MRRLPHLGNIALGHNPASRNEEPRPYLWTKSADAILDNLTRFCGRTLESQGAVANF